MMNGLERASIFGDDTTDLSDLSDFRPDPVARTAAPEPDRKELKRLGERSGFESREPRRHRTGRDTQLNMRVKASDKDRFYAIADRMGWVMGETLEHALDALEAKLAE